MEQSQSMRGQLFVLRTLQFANYASMALLVTYFPLYFESMGFSKQQIGTFYSVGPFLSIVANLLVGILSDRTKNLPRILNILYLVQILALALLLPQKEFGIMAGILALFYLAQTPNNSMLDSVSLLAAERMKIGFTAIRMYGSLGYAVCSVIFGFILKTYASNLTIWLLLCVVLVSLVSSFFVADYQAKLRKFEFSGLVGLLRRREPLVFFGLIMLVSVAHRMNEAFLSVGMREIGADDSVIGFASSASAVSEIPMFFLLAKYGHRFREFPLLAIASAFYTIRLGLLSMANEPWMMVGLQMMHAFTFAIFYITALRCLQGLIPDEYRSSSQAVFAVVWSGLAGLIAGKLGGWLYDSFGLSYVFRTGSIFALIGMLGFLLVHFRQRQ
ncbi:MFS transporter [Cohnella boryungensis]|uniref:MFS transporter n=1 Tax=Cohnella boryungensis TaxID=768479 RepID=A0ABV8SH90_9BACL